MNIVYNIEAITSLLMSLNMMWHEIRAPEMKSKLTTADLSMT